MYSFYGKCEAILFIAGVQLSPVVAACLFSLNSLRRYQYQTELIAEAIKENGVFQSYHKIQHGFLIDGIVYWSMGVAVSEFKGTTRTRGHYAVS